MAGGAGGRIPGGVKIQIGGKGSELEGAVPIVDVIILRRRILTVRSHLHGGGHHGDGGECSGETRSKAKTKPGASSLKRLRFLMCHPS